MRWVLFGVISALILGAFAAPPAKRFPEPELARVVFFHLPCAFASVVFILMGGSFAWRYLSSQEMVWEHRSHAATQVGAGLALATMLTGILFSKAQWGAWWHWDPRQTSFLIVLLLQASYFAVRMAFEDETTRARASNTYLTLTLLPVLFLIFVFPRLPQVLKTSLHPSTTVQTGGFSPDYWLIVMGMFIALLVHGLWLYRLLVRTSLIEDALENHHGNLETSGGAAPTHRLDHRIRPHESPGQAG